MSKGCPVCRAWHDGRESGECGHWCHFAGAEDWDEPCQVIFAATGACCGEPAAGLYRGGCVHEHVSERWLCAEHATKSHSCTACYRAGHDCAVALELLGRAAMPGVSG